MLSDIIKNILDESRFITVWLLTPIVLVAAYEIIFYSSKYSLKSEFKNTHFFANFYHEKQVFKISELIKKSVFVPTLVFSIFLFIYIFLMCYKEEFAYIDNFQFTDFSLRGTPLSMPIWRGNGRFWPLGLQEYNFLALLGKSQLIYRSYSIFQLIILIFAVGKILDKVPIWYKYLTLFFLLTTTAFVISFFGFIYSERNILLFLTLIILAYRLFLKSKSNHARFYMYAVLIFAQLCLYYKEPVFVLLGVFSISRIIINLSSIKKPFTYKKCKQFLKKNYIDVGLLMLSSVYFILYRIEVFPHITNAYNDNLFPDTTSLDACVWWIKNQPILIVFFIVFIMRIISAIVRKTNIDTIQEPLALGAISYFIVYVKLRMMGDYSIYYIAPVLLIITLYLSHFIYQFLSRSKYKLPIFKKLCSIFLITLLFLVLLHQSIQKSSRVILERKLYIDGRVKIVHSLAEYTEKSSDNSFVLFFDKNGIYEGTIFHFARFLDYNGFKIYDDSQDVLKTSTNVHSFTGILTKKVTLTLKAPLNFLDNKCVPWHNSTKCFSTNNPQKNDFIVLLPGYYAPDYINDLKANSTLLTGYQFSENASFIDKMLYKFTDQQPFYRDFYLFRKR
ncbi:hypothetical protein [Crocosphaera sp. Alani8]|uniref:hypothetical protein n=1 Tax=Crocosphaera sp. Alani8 TaxID=3038952 RepID=UPI00313D9647